MVPISNKGVKKRDDTLQPQQNYNMTQCEQQAIVV